MDFGENEAEEYEKYKEYKETLSRSVPRCGPSILRKSAACPRLNGPPFASIRGFFVLFAPYRGYSCLRFSSLRLCGFA
jgi:hypothetical protein